MTTNEKENERQYWISVIQESLPSMNLDELKEMAPTIIKKRIETELTPNPSSSIFDNIFDYSKPFGWNAARFYKFVDLNFNGDKVKVNFVVRNLRFFNSFPKHIQKASFRTSAPKDFISFLIEIIENKPQDDYSVVNPIYDALLNGKTAKIGNCDISMKFFQNERIDIKGFSEDIVQMIAKAIEEHKPYTSRNLSRPTNPYSSTWT